MMARFEVYANIYEEIETPVVLRTYDTLLDAIDSVLPELIKAFNYRYEAYLYYNDFDYFGDMSVEERHVDTIGTAETYHEAMALLPTWVEDAKNHEYNVNDELGFRVEVVDDSMNDNIDFARYILDTETEIIIDDCDVHNDYLCMVMPDIEIRT